MFDKSNQLQWESSTDMVKSRRRTTLLTFNVTTSWQKMSHLKLQNWLKQEFSRHWLSFRKHLKTGNLMAIWFVVADLLTRLYLLVRHTIQDKFQDEKWLQIPCDVVSQEAYKLPINEGWKLYHVNVVQFQAHNNSIDKPGWFSVNDVTVLILHCSWSWDEPGKEKQLSRALYCKNIANKHNGLYCAKCDHYLLFHEWQRMWQTCRYSLHTEIRKPPDWHDVFKCLRESSISWQGMCPSHVANSFLIIFTRIENVLCLSIQPLISRQWQRWWLKEVSFSILMTWMVWQLNILSQSSLSLIFLEISWACARKYLASLIKTRSHWCYGWKGSV